MSRLRVHSFSISVDGYGAGPDQSLQAPLGAGGMALHTWAFATQAFQDMHGQGVGSTGVDNAFIARGTENLGAWILGRNMFGPIRGPWSDNEWKGWWGESPPYHTPVFVLTHHPRPSLTMQGDTTFHFVTEGIHAALAQARAAAGSRDIRVGGGVATVQQYLRAGLIDEMHLAIAPAILGSGEHLLADVNLTALGYRVSEHVAGEQATHVVLERSSNDT